MAKIPINLQKGTIEKKYEVGTIVGIDLGTTNSLIAYISDGNPVTITDEDGKSSLVPSVIHIDRSGKMTVGNEAKSHLVRDPMRTLYSVKRLLGKSYGDLYSHRNAYAYKIIDNDEESLVKIQVDDRFYSPVELSAEILKRLKSIAEKHLDQVIEKAVITVPAYFNDSQRQATRDAGKLAGLDVLRIINEPTAAALAYDIGTTRQDDKKVAVYDLGGGTFDISILQIHEGIFEVMATHGDTYLGGDDFDQLIVDKWKNDQPDLFKTLHKNKALLQRIRLEAERAKRTLTSNDRFDTVVEGTVLHLNRSEFEALVRPLVERTIESCRRCVKDSGLTVKDINHVIIVGGSTRIPLVKAMVSEFFEKPVNDTVDPDQTVALGAAVQADILAGNRRDMLLLDITPLSLGIETIGGLMDTIIPRNAKIPTSAGRQYTTSIDGQTKLRISVFQGERDLVSDNRKLGEFILHNIPPMAAGIPKIDIHFIIDADGILKVRAKELRSNVETEVEIKSQYGISEEDMARMLQESIANAQRDRDRRALIESRTEAKNLILHTKKFISQNGDWLSQDEIRLLEAQIDHLRQAVDGTDKDAIQEALEKLNTLSRPLAEKAMDHHISDALKGKNV